MMNEIELGLTRTEDRRSAPLTTGVQYGVSCSLSKYHYALRLNQKT